MSGAMPARGSARLPLPRRFDPAPRRVAPALRLRDEATARRLLISLGPSLGLWRAAEVAVLRTQRFDPPVLDLGCGDGLVMSQVTPVDIGIDPDQQALRKARETSRYRSVIATNAEEMPVGVDSMGTVVANSVLEHLAPLDDVLDRARQVLRPGGSLVITTPSATFSRSLVLPLRPYTRWRNRCLLHRQLWTAAEWGDRLWGHGFVVSRVRGYLRPGLVRLWDAMDVAERLWVGRSRLVGEVWRRLPDKTVARLAHELAEADLGADPDAGGGLLVVARRVR